MQHIKSNFKFLEEYAPDHYAVLRQIEANSRIDPHTSSILSRNLLESFINSKMQEAGPFLEEKGRELPWNMSLHDKIQTLQDASQLYSDELPRPFLYPLSFQDIDERPLKTPAGDPIDGYMFIRVYGNSSAHITDRHNVRSTDYSYHSTLLALKFFCALFHKEYPQAEGDIRDFSQRNLPIGKYYIVKHKAAPDAEETSCRREYFCYYYPGRNTEIKQHALIREYTQTAIDEEHFLARNVDAISEINNAIQNSKYEVHVQQLNHIEPGSRSANYYLAYEFPRKILRMKDVVESLDTMQDKMTLLLRLSRIIYKFHNADNPIYVRTLMPDSVVLNDYRDDGDGLIPYIIKLDFAKLTSMQDHTVVGFLQQAERDTEDEREMLLRAFQKRRYLPDIMDERTRWDKADIHALGVMFYDILYGAVSIKPVNSERIERLSRAPWFLKSNTISLLDRMTSARPSERPDIKKVTEIIEEEYRRWV